jgi:hypothetical protein
MRQSGRIEIANNAGTPAQDAVAGRESSQAFAYIESLG